MMRQSVQTVLPESTGHNTLSLRDSVCRDLFQLFSSPHSPLPILLVSGMPEWQGHNQSDKLLQSWYCRQLRSALLFHEPRIAALQVNLKAVY
ncbi:anti-adapter protein IraD, partial [Escherichia coli]